MRTTLVVTMPEDGVIISHVPGVRSEDIVAEVVRAIGRLRPGDILMMDTPDSTTAHPDIIDAYNMTFRRGIAVLTLDTPANTTSIDPEITSKMGHNLLAGS